MSVLKLDRGVMNSKLTGKHLTDPLANSFTLRSRHVEDVNMTGECIGARSQAPDMNVMNSSYSGNSKHRLRDAVQAHSLGKAFQQDIGRIRDDAESGPEDQPGNQEGNQGIDQRLPGLLNQPGAGNDGNIVERVAEVVNEDGAQIQVAAPRRQR